jgi:hypothetical protein
VLTESESHLGQESSALVVDALLTEAGAPDVSEPVEDGERVSVHQDAASGEIRRRDTDDLVRVDLFVSGTCRSPERR